jgi:hypothetical protein
MGYADDLFGPIRGNELHSDLYGSAPGGHVVVTTGKHAAGVSGADQAALLEHRGVKAMLLQGPLLGVILVGAGFMVINAMANG